MLENFLARLRAAKAESLITPKHRGGRILDIGCGSFPYFLAHTKFRERFGIDKMHSARKTITHDGITLKNQDIERTRRLPFSNGYFDVVTMLAVFEHIEHDRLVGLLREVRRVLRPGGSFIMTTPAGWTEQLLRFLSAVKLLSSQEVDEHKDAYSPVSIARILTDAGFSRDAMRIGYFELGMNIFVRVAK